MAVTKTEINPLNKNMSSSTPARSMGAFQLVFAGDTFSGWVNKEFYAMTNFSWLTDVALTCKFKGRYRKDDGTFFGECYIGDKDGVNIELDLSIGHATFGSTFPIDLAAPFDEIAFELSGADSGTYFLGFAG